MAETHAVRVPPTVYEQAQEIQEQFNYATIGEAVRHMCREDRGYEV